MDFVHRSLAKELGGPTTGTGDLRQTAMTGDVLDLGCGDGSVSAWIATRKLPVARVPQPQHVHRLLNKRVPWLSQMCRCRVVQGGGGRPLQRSAGLRPQGLPFGGQPLIPRTS